MDVLQLLNSARDSISQAIAQIEATPGPAPVGDPKIVLSIEWDTADGPQKQIIGEMTLAQAQEIVP